VGYVDSMHLDGSPPGTGADADAGADVGATLQEDLNAYQKLGTVNKALKKEPAGKDVR